MKYVKHGYDLPCYRIFCWKCNLCLIEFKTKRDMANHIEQIHKIKVRLTKRLKRDVE